MTNPAAVTEVGAASGAAVLFASGAVLARRGLHGGSLLGGLLVSLGVGWVSMLVVVLATTWPAGSPDWRAVALFGLGGIAAPGLGRVAVFAGMRRIGASRAVPLQAATYPLLATAAAVVVLAEPVNALRIAGTLLIVAGVTIVASAFRAGDRSVPRRLPALGIVFPLAAGLAYAAGDLLRAGGLRWWAAPAVGAMIGLGAALAFWLTLAALVPAVRRRVQVRGGSARWFVASGLCSAAAILGQFVALANGRVSVVSPIIATQPFLVVVLSAIFLRELEGSDWQRFTGSALTMAGAIAVSVSGLA